MKNSITFIILFFMIACSARFRPGTIYYTNGNSKSGLVDFDDHIVAMLFETGNSVGFKSEEAAETEKIKSDDIYKVEFPDSNGSALYYRLYVMSGSIDNPQKSKQKNWFYQFSKDGKVSFVGYEKSGVQEQFPGTYYFLHAPGSDSARYLWLDAYEPGSKKKMMENIKNCFSDLCPEVVKASVAGVFKNKKASAIIKYYFENCPE